MDSLKSGDLDRLIYPQRRGDTSPKVGQPKPNWVELAPLHAKVGNVQYVRAAIFRSLTLDGNVEVQLRYKDWLNESYKIRIDADLFTISNISGDRKRNVMVLLLKYEAKSE